MNERIKELAEQAGMTDDKFGMFFAKDKHDEDGVDLAKFAKLIIRECIESVKQDMHSGHSHSDFSTGYDAALEIAVCNIEEKFGIE